MAIMPLGGVDHNLDGCQWANHCHTTHRTCILTSCQPISCRLRTKSMPSTPTSWGHAYPCWTAQSQHLTYPTGTRLAATSTTTPRLERRPLRAPLSSIILRASRSGSQDHQWPVNWTGPDPKKTGPYKDRVPVRTSHGLWSWEKREFYRTSKRLLGPVLNQFRRVYDTESILML